MPAWMLNPMPIMSLAMLWWALAPETAKPITSSWLQLAIAALVALQLFFQWKKATEDRLRDKQRHDMDMLHRQQLHEEQINTTKEEIRVVENKLDLNTQMTAQAASNGDSKANLDLDEALKRYDSLRRPPAIDPATGDEAYELPRQERVLRPHSRAHEETE